MKTITLENGTKVQISDEEHKRLENLQKPVWKDVVRERMLSELSMDFFYHYGSDRFSWRNNATSQKEFGIYLHMLLWKETYDKDFEPDWEDLDQKKYFIFYYHYKIKLVCDYTFGVQQIMQVYISTEEKAEQMLEDLKSIGVL